MSRSASRSRRSVGLWLALAWLSAAATPARAAGDDWHPVLHDDGVEVRERDVPGRSLPDFQGEEVIDADPYQILAVITDVPAQTTWMWQCAESSLLESDGDAVQVIHHRIKAHWPATDRDVVFRSVARVVEPGRELAVRFSSESNAAAPPVSGLVRMPLLEGEFDLVALGPERSRVTYTVAADPGGVLPATFLSETVRQSPVDTLVGLRRRVAETRGRYPDVIARWRARR